MENEIKAASTDVLHPNVFLVRIVQGPYCSIVSQDYLFKRTARVMKSCSLNCVAYRASIEINTRKMLSIFWRSARHLHGPRNWSVILCTVVNLQTARKCSTKASTFERFRERERERESPAVINGRAFCLLPQIENSPRGDNDRRASVSSLTEDPTRFILAIYDFAALYSRLRSRFCAEIKVPRLGETFQSKNIARAVDLANKLLALESVLNQYGSIGRWKFVEINSRRWSIYVTFL